MVATNLEGGCCRWLQGNALTGTMPTELGLLTAVTYL
jgi:hypothetical protein